MDTVEASTLPSAEQPLRLAGLHGPGGRVQVLAALAARAGAS